MTRKFLRNETLIYAAAFLLALAIRLAGIGRAPLTDTEATLALQALALSKGQETLLGGQPAYLVLSTLWMFLFGASHWTARFWPAVAGSALVLCPALFKHHLGKVPALVLAFLLVFDPAMLAVSQEASGKSFVVLFLVLFAGFFLARRPALAGAAAGMALLSGPDLWEGVLGIGLALIVSRLLGFLPLIQPANEEPVNETNYLIPAVFPWRTLLWFLLGTLFFVGTLFFALPRGLSALAGGMAAYFRGWVIPGQTPAELLLLSFVVYEFLLLFLGIWGAITGLVHRNPVERFLLIWALLSLVVVVIYPARDVSSIAWVILPLAALAARQGVRMADVAAVDFLPTLGQAVLSGLILGFFSLTALAMVNNPQFTNEQEYWLRLTGALIMVIASTGLIAWGWSREISLRGLSWGFSLILVIYLVSSAWNVSGLSSRSGMDFWKMKSNLPDERILLSTLERLNQWAPPVSGGYDLIVVGIQSPSLQWALRDYDKVEFTSQFPVGKSPAILITHDQSNLPFTVPYRGEGFLLAQDIGWRLIHPEEWLRWMAFRVVPSEVVLKEEVILWARTDLFPGFEAAAQAEQPPAIEQENPK